MGKGRVTLKGNATTQNVLYVKGLRHDQLSVEKMCDDGYNLTFYDKACDIRRNVSNKVIGRGTRTLGNVYILDEIQGEKCYIGQTNESWICHKMPGHLNFDNLMNIYKKQAIRGPPKISKPTNNICKSCQLGEKPRTNFKIKEDSTSRPLELVHIDLCGPVRTQTL